MFRTFLCLGIAQASLKIFLCLGIAQASLALLSACGKLALRSTCRKVSQKYKKKCIYQ